MFEVTVRGSFIARHALRSRGGITEPLHTHEWRVSVTYAGERLDDQGVLVDFGLIRKHLDGLLGPLADQDLGRTRLLAGRNPSAENMARAVSNRLPATLPNGVRPRCVEVEEEPGCVARYFLPSQD